MKVTYACHHQGNKILIILVKDSTKYTSRNWELLILNLKFYFTTLNLFSWFYILNYLEGQISLLKYSSIPVGHYRDQIQEYHPYKKQKWTPPFQNKRLFQSHRNPIKNPLVPNLKYGNSRRLVINCYWILVENFLVVGDCKTGIYFKRCLVHALAQWYNFFDH